MKSWGIRAVDQVIIKKKAKSAREQITAAPILRQKRTLASLTGFDAVASDPRRAKVEKASRKETTKVTKTFST